MEISGPWRVVWLDRLFSCWQVVGSWVVSGPWRVVWLDRLFSCWQDVGSWVVSGPWRAVWLDRLFFCWQDVGSWVVSGPWRVVWLDRPFSCWQVVGFSFFVCRISFADVPSCPSRSFGWVEGHFAESAKDLGEWRVEMLQKKTVPFYSFLKSSLFATCHFIAWGTIEGVDPIPVGHT